jgi:hypothetical protein
MEYNNCDYCGHVPEKYATRENVCDIHEREYYPRSIQPKHKVHKAKVRK